MPKFDSKDYLTIEDYIEAANAFHVVSGLVMCTIDKQECHTKDLIIRNFIARADMTLNAILRLFEIGDYLDCWILHRCLLDRLFHLVHLCETNEFELFEEWSFCKQYEAQNRVRSDIEFQGCLDSQSFSPSDEQRNRYNILRASPPQWKRPKAEDVAMSMDLKFLYKYGYDYASAAVHPMADDGQQDFFTITHLKPKTDFPDQRAVISNSFLAGCLILQSGLNHSSVRWLTLVHDFIRQLLDCLHNGANDYKITALKIVQAERRMSLCQPRSQTASS